MTCEICGREMVLEVLNNHSGYYLGYLCPWCGLETRETNFYATYEEAAYAHSTFEEVKNASSETRST